MGRYISYLAGVGFLEQPQGQGKERLPKSQISQSQKDALLRVGGRGALV